MTVREFNLARVKLRMSDRESARLADIQARAKVILDKRGLDASVRYMNNRCLRSAGAAARGIMVKSMRDADDHGLNRKAAKPGRPPLAHKDRGRKLKRLITFQLEGGSDPHTVVIGPTLIRSSSRVPAIMERGGTVTVFKNIRIKPNGLQVQPDLRFTRTLTVASDPAAAERQKEHIRDYYKSLRTVQVRVTGVRILARPFALPVYKKLTRKGVARFWFNQLRAVR